MTGEVDKIRKNNDTRPSRSSTISLEKGVSWLQVSPKKSQAGRLLIRIHLRLVRRSTTTNRIFKSARKRQRSRSAISTIPAHSLSVRCRRSTSRATANCVRRKVPLPPQTAGSVFQMMTTVSDVMRRTAISLLVAEPIIINSSIWKDAAHPSREPSFFPERAEDQQPVLE